MQHSRALLRNLRFILRIVKHYGRSLKENNIRFVFRKISWLLYGAELAGVSLEAIKKVMTFVIIHMRDDIGLDKCSGSGNGESWIGLRKIGG